jgi:basic membrane protein A
MRFITWKAVVLIVLAALLAVGTALAAPGRSEHKASKVKVALLMPCAINDRTWCQAGYDAAKRLEREGKIQLRVVSNAPFDTAGISQLMARYAQNGQQLVIAHSSWQDAALAVATKFPKTAFVFGGGGKVASNVGTYEEPVYLPSYLGGILAAGITRTGVVGGIGAMDIPICHAALQAFIRGAKSVKPSVKLLNTYIGSWSDAAKAKEATLAQADGKADVFVPCGDGPARGMIQAIKQKNLSGYGFVGDMNSLAPSNMIGSFVYNLYPMFASIVADVAAGKFHGKSYDVGLKSFTLKLNPKYKAGTIPASVRAKMLKVQKAALAGTFKIPYILH